VRLPPLADLHRHLDGSLRESTLRELAAPLGVRIPDGFRFFPGMGLAAALSRFELSLAVLQTPAAVQRVGSEICEDAAAEGVTTLEIRFAPQLHKGAALEAIVEAAAEGVAGRAGLILCGLFGEDPEVVEALVAAARARPAVVGIDLAGGPSPAHRNRLRDYARAFSLARDLGLGRTVHAGEGRPPSEIRAAIEHLHAQRIGHGTTLPDDPAVLDLVRERGVTVEACLTSNVQTGVVAGLDDHPLPAMLAGGVRATVCTDNTLFSDVDAPGEYRRAASLPGMGASAIEVLAAFGHAAAFPRRDSAVPMTRSGS
jgi:adenosine deaminase